MKINKIHISGFKNLNNITLTLDNLIALISLNNYGKSNLLKAIDFGVNFIKCNENSKEKMMRLTSAIPLNKKLENNNYTIEFDFSTTIHNDKTNKDEIYNIKYGFSFIWIKDNNTGCKINKEFLKIKGENDLRHSTFIDRENELALYKKALTGRCTNKISINDNELIINKLKAYDDLYYHEIIKRINEINISIDRHFDTQSLYSSAPIISKEIDVFDLNKNFDVPRAIFELKKNHNDKYKQLIYAFTLLFPRITKIEVNEILLTNNLKNLPENIPFKISNAIYKIMVYDKNLNQPISFESMSDGARRIFLQLFNIIIAEIRGFSLLAIEEPENSIHPSLLQSYLRIISEFKGNCNIIITSHSPYLLQYLNPSSIYVGIPNDKGIAKFSNIKKSMEKSILNDANKNQISVGDYIFDLLNGDDDDMKFLNKLLNEDNLYE